MNYEVTGADATHRISVRRDAEGALWVRHEDGEEVRFDASRLSGSEWRIAGERRPIGVSVVAEVVDVTLGGDPFRFSVVDARRAALRAGSTGGADQVRTQMPGAVVRLLVAVGDTVSEGQPVIVVEAMKMENEFKAQMSGVVTQIHVAPGDTLESGTLLISIGEPQ